MSEPAVAGASGQGPLGTGKYQSRLRTVEDTAFHQDSWCRRPCTHQATLQCMFLVLSLNFLLVVSGIEPRGDLPPSILKVSF